MIPGQTTGDPVVGAASAAVANPLTLYRILSECGRGGASRVANVTLNDVPNARAVVDGEAGFSPLSVASAGLV